MSRRVVTDEERRSRLGGRHGLAHRPDGVSELATRLVGLHSSDPTTVFLTIASRRAADSVADVERELYDERGVLRMMGMRRTLWVVPRHLVTVVQRGFTDTLVPKARQRTAVWFEGSGLTDDGEGHIDRMISLVMDHLEAAGEATTRDMTKAIPRLDERFLPAGSPKWATPQSVGSLITQIASVAGLIARARPLGTWISSQYRYSPMERWLGHPIGEMPAGEARARLARAWLGSFGPGTLTDLKWWTGWTVAQTRAALAEVGAVEIGLTNGVGFLLPDDLEAVDAPAPWAALLPSLDPTSMGWKERVWYFGDHISRLFDRNGNAGPTVWWNGRVVGGWAQRSDGEIVVEYLEEVSPECRRLVEIEADHLTAWVGTTRFTPRFRTPLEQSLTRQ